MQFDRLGGTRMGEAVGRGPRILGGTREMTREEILTGGAPWQTREMLSREMKEGKLRGSRARSHMWTPEGVKTVSTGRLPGTRKLGWKEKAVVSDDFTAYMTGKSMVKGSVVAKQQEQLNKALESGAPIPVKD